ATVRQWLNGYPFAPATTRFWQRGLLKKESDFNHSNELVSSIESFYEFYETPLKTVIGVKVSGYDGSSTNSSYSYSYGRYKVEQMPFVLDKTIEKIYDSVDPGNESKVQVRKTMYEYDDTYYLPKRTTSYVSDS